MESPSIKYKESGCIIIESEDLDSFVREHYGVEDYSVVADMRLMEGQLLYVYLYQLSPYWRLSSDKLQDVLRLAKWQLGYASPYITYWLLSDMQSQGVIPATKVVAIHTPEK